MVVLNVLLTSTTSANVDTRALCESLASKDASKTFQFVTKATLNAEQTEVTDTQLAVAAQQYITGAVNPLPFGNPPVTLPPPSTTLPKVYLFSSNDLPTTLEGVTAMGSTLHCVLNVTAAVPIVFQKPETPEATKPGGKGAQAKPKPEPKKPVAKGKGAAPQPTPEEIAAQLAAQVPLFKQIQNKLATAPSELVLLEVGMDATALGPAEAASTLIDSVVKCVTTLNDELNEYEKWRVSQPYVEMSSVVPSAVRVKPVSQGDVTDIRALVPSVVWSTVDASLRQGNDRVGWTFAAPVTGRMSPEKMNLATSGVDGDRPATNNSTRSTNTTMTQNNNNNTTTTAASATTLINVPSKGVALAPSEDLGEDALAALVAMALGGSAPPPPPPPSSVMSGGSAPTSPPDGAQRDPFIGTDSQSLKLKALRAVHAYALSKYKKSYEELVATSAATTTTTATELAPSESEHSTAGVSSIMMRSVDPREPIALRLTPFQVEHNVTLLRLEDVMKKLEPNVDKPLTDRIFTEYISEDEFLQRLYDSTSQLHPPIMVTVPETTNTCELLVLYDRVPPSRVSVDNIEVSYFNTISFFQWRQWKADLQGSSAVPKNSARGLWLQSVLDPSKPRIRSSPTTSLEKSVRVSMMDGSRLTCALVKPCNTLRCSVSTKEGTVFGFQSSGYATRPYAFATFLSDMSCMTISSQVPPPTLVAPSLEDSVGGSNSSGTKLLTTIQYSDASWGTVGLHSDGTVTLMEPNGPNTHNVQRFNPKTNKVETVFLREEASVGRRMYLNKKKKYVYVVVPLQDDTVLVQYPNGDTLVQYKGTTLKTVVRTGFRKVTFAPEHGRSELVLSQLEVTSQSNEEHRAIIYTTSTNIVSVRKHNTSTVTLFGDGTRILRTADQKFRLERSDRMFVEVSFDEGGGHVVTQVVFGTTRLRCVLDYELCLRRQDDFYVRVDQTYHLTFVEIPLVSMPDASVAPKGEGVYVMDHLYGGMRVLESDGTTVLVESSGAVRVMAHDDVGAHHPLMDLDSDLATGLTSMPAVTTFQEEVKALLAKSIEEYESARARKVIPIPIMPPNITLPLQQRLQAWQRKAAVPQKRNQGGGLAATTTASSHKSLPLNATGASTNPTPTLPNNNNNTATATTTTPTNLKETIVSTATGGPVTNYAYNNRTLYTPIMFALSPLHGISQIMTPYEVLPYVVSATKPDGNVTITEDPVAGEPGVLQLSFHTRTVTPVVGDTTRGNVANSLVLSQLPPYLLPRNAVDHTSITVSSRHLIRHTPLTPDERSNLLKVLALNSHLAKVKARYVASMVVHDTRGEDEISQAQDIQRKFHHYMENVRMVAAPVPTIPLDTLPGGGRLDLTSTVTPANTTTKPPSAKPAAGTSSMSNKSKQHQSSIMSSSAVLDATPKFQVDPGAVEFGMVKPGYKYVSQVRVLNVSDRELHFRVARSQNKYLHVEYSKRPVPISGYTMVSFYLTVPKGTEHFGTASAAGGQGIVIEDPTLVDVVKFENAGAKQIGLGSVAIEARATVETKLTLSQCVSPNVQVVGAIDQS